MTSDIFIILLFTLILPLCYCQLTFYLPSEKAAEGPCTLAPVATNINARWLSQPRTYYITFGNKAMIRRSAEIFLGRPANSVDELNALCLQVKLSGKMMTTYAYRNLTVEQSCTSKKTGIYNCFAKTGSPGTNLTAIDTSMETVVYTDNKSSLLIVRCINNDFRDYKLLATSATPDTKVVSEVKALITRIGFTTLYSTKLSCDGEYAI